MQEITQHPVAPPLLAAFARRPLQAILERIFNLPRVCAAALALWVFLLLPRPIDDPDIGWHLRNAAAQCHTHAFLAADTYSFTAPGARWINHEWLAELPYYLGWRVAGNLGLYAVTLLVLEWIFLSLFRLALKKSGSLPAALFVAVLASVLATVSFGPRTLLFGWALLLIELALLDAFIRTNSRPRSIYALPVLFAIWINTHGSWLIGLVLFAVFALSRLRPIDWGAFQSPAWSSAQRRTLGLVFLLSLAALLLNPYGWHLIAYPFDLAFRQKLNIANVEEWQPLNFHSARGLVFLVSLAMLFVSQLAPRKAGTGSRRGMDELAFLSIGIYSAVIHARFLFLAAILVMPVLARELAILRLPLSPKTKRNPRQLPAGLGTPLHAALMLAMLLLAVRIGSTRPNPPLAQQPFPGAAATFLAHFQPQGRVFNEFRWGGSLEFSAPQIPVFIDSRVDIFERNGVLSDYLDIVRLHGSLALLDKYRIRYVLFERDAPIIYLLQQTHAWRTDYDDGEAILLERSNPDKSER